MPRVNGVEFLIKICTNFQIMLLTFFFHSLTGTEVENLRLSANGYRIKAIRGSLSTPQILMKRYYRSYCSAEETDRCDS